MNRRAFILTICVLLAFSTGCAENAPVETEEPTPSAEWLEAGPRRFTCPEEQKELFFQNEQSFNLLETLLEESPYAFLSVSFYNPEKTEWYILLDKPDESGPEGLTRITEDELDTQVKQGILSFAESVPCEHIHWEKYGSSDRFGVRDGEPFLEVSLWSEIAGGDGFVYGTISDNPIENNEEPITDNWYYHWFFGT